MAHIDTMCHDAAAFSPANYCATAAKSTMFLSISLKQLAYLALCPELQHFVTFNDSLTMRILHRQFVWPPFKIPTKKQRFARLQLFSKVRSSPFREHTPSLTK